jgi:hypothetical protein
MRYLSSEVNNRILVVIENNSIGSAIIENLENSSESPTDKFNYTRFLYIEDSQKDQFKYGANTNVKTKDQMISIYYDYIISEPNLIKSADLINQLSIIEKKSNGSIASKHGHHDDLFMASCLCAYAKKKTILDSIYASLDDVKIIQMDKQDDMLLNNIIVSDSKKQKIITDVFFSERELLKEMGDFDDFVF